MRGPNQIEHNQKVVNRYQELGHEWPATMNQVAAWAIREGLWKPRHDSLIRQCAEQLAEAMREEYYVDPQGRTVRTKHAARVMLHGDQHTFWDDIRTAPPKHMLLAFQQRRQQIVGDCRQLKNDVDSYNENTNAGRPIQLILDFTQDVAELEATDALDRRRSSAPPPSFGQFPGAPPA